MFQLSPANNASAKHPPVVRACGRPSNVTQQTASFNIDVNQWVGFQGAKAAFLWSGTIPEKWPHKPLPNLHNPKFVSVTGVLNGVKVSGAAKRYHVDITSVTFLGSTPPAAPGG
jgi:hypothetical protein